MERVVIMNLSPQNNVLYINKNQYNNSHYFPYYSFCDCENIESIDVEKGHPHLYSINNCLIHKNEPGNLLLGCKSSKIPCFITKINYPAFYKRQGIESIDLPFSVEIIGSSSFYGCDLKSIKFSKNITEIRYDAFRECASLSTVEFSPYIEKIGDNAFRDCTSLLELCLPDSVKKIGCGAFRNCTSLKTVQLSEQLLKISSDMFKNCKNLEQIYIPDGVNFVAGGSFSGCSSLEYINVPKKDDKIRESTFFGCTNLKLVEIPYGVKEIQARAFRGCDALQRIYIPSSVNKISSDAFNYVKYSNGTDYSLTIYSAEGSYAEKYAKRNGYDFVAVTEENVFPIVCPECDTDIVKNARYCHNCGKQIRDE